LHEAVAEAEAADALNAVFFDESVRELLGGFVGGWRAFEPGVWDKPAAAGVGGDDLVFFPVVG
jgi:hypothetical protein